MGKTQTNINIHFQYWNTEKDSINLYSAIDIPLNRLVFQKEKEIFFSEITFTVVITNEKEKTQAFRKSWNEKIIESYYEDTRNRDNIFRTELNIPLCSGEYKFFLNIQDKDSRENWKKTQEVELEDIEYLGPALPFAINSKGEYKLLEPMKESIDTLYLRCQVNPADTANTGIFYKIYTMNSTVDSGKVYIPLTGIHNLYFIPIPFGFDNKDHYEIELSYFSEKQIVNFDFGKKNRRYWTSDIKEIVGVMHYILPTYSAYKELKGLDQKAQWKKVNAYWQEKDPEPDTPGNPLLEELNNRVRFVNKNFSVLMEGWRSDRGRIYIIYGEPHFVDTAYQDKMGYQYQKWVYPNGKEFIFIDRTMSGDYTLFNERF